MRSYVSALGSLKLTVALLLLVGVVLAAGTIVESTRGAEAGRAIYYAPWFFGLQALFALNATGVALVIRHFAPLLSREGRPVLASLSARVGSIGDNGLGGWVSYRAAKAAQNQIIRTAAIEWRRRNPRAVLVALHPGTVATPLTAKYAARHPTISPDESARALLDVIAALTPDDSGSFRDWKGQIVPW